MHDRAVSSTGVKVYVNKPPQRIPAFNGRHLWIFIGMWQVQNPVADHQNFDAENLISVQGPGCYWCEEPWTPTMGSRCPGEPK